MPRPYSDFFSDFLEILRPRNRDLKNTHGTFRGRHVQVYASFQQTFSKQLYAFGDFPFRQQYTWKIPTVPFAVVTCRFTLLSNKRSRNSFMHLVIFHFVNSIHHSGGGGGGSRNERKLEDGMVNFTNFIFEIIFRAYANLPSTKDLC